MNRTKKYDPTKHNEYRQDYDDGRTNWLLIQKYLSKPSYDEIVINDNLYLYMYV
jgi:hypothetical protein